MITNKNKCIQINFDRWVNRGTLSSIINEVIRKKETNKQQQNQQFLAHKNFCTREIFS